MRNCLESWRVTQLRPLLIGDERCTQVSHGTTAGDDSNVDVLLVAVLNDRLYIEGGEISIYNETDDTLVGESYWRTVLSTVNYSSRH